MLDPKTMSPEQEGQARAQAFYLLKKFTSYTFLDKARALYQGFLDAFARKLNELPPSANARKAGALVSSKERYQSYYKSFLEYMIPIEEGLHLLRHTAHKVEAYRQFEGCTGPISRALFGRDAHEKGTSYEPFFQSLGMAEEDSEKPDEGVIKDVLEVIEILIQGRLTIFDRKITNLETWKVAMAYNYETMFDEPYFRAAPRYKRPYYPHIYPFNFPSPLPGCPERNTRQEGQVWSGEAMPVSGIYEPWFIGGQHVGCPNYFLAGQEGIEYQMEGTQDKEIVAWRLIWQDKRYLDGAIAREEQQYLRELSAEPSQQKTVLSAQPGQACPREGVWFAPHLDKKEVQMKQGQPMPGELYGPTGG